MSPSAGAAGSPGRWEPWESGISSQRRREDPGLMQGVASVLLEAGDASSGQLTFMVTILLLRVLSAPISPGNPLRRAVE